MKRNKAMLTTVALGAAYLMRNEKARNKMMDQLKSLGNRKSK